jgi:polysaccharide export outer membrane protein
MRHTYGAFIIGVLITGLTACASTGGTPDLPPESEGYGVVSGEYRIDVSDQVSISVWKNPELNVSEPVRPDGKIAVHLVGDITAAGKTPEQLADDIERELSSYIKDPNVTVILTGLAGQNYRSMIRVTGAVGNVTSLNYSQGMTVIDAVLGAGGLDLYANGNQAKLHRQGESGISSYDIRLKDIMEKGDMTTNVRLMPGDVITVPESAF